MTDALTTLVAVDAGGTSTRAMVVRTPGECLAYARAGSGNPVAVGPRRAAASVVESVGEALAGAGVSSTDIRQVTLAMAGAGSAAVSDEIRHSLAAIGLDAPVVFDSDLLATYFSGTHEPHGYALIAGTGAGAIRVEDGRQVAVADALGWLLGDEGSGFWIGQRVVRAALADLDGRGPATALTALLLARLGVPTPPGAGGREPVTALVRLLYAAPPVRLADHAGLAFEVEGDTVAGRILDEAAAALARTLTAVRSPAVAGPVVLGGGVLGRSSQIADRLVAACGPQGLDPSRVHAVADGAAGVCVLALRHAGSVVDEAVFRRLTASLTAVR